MMAAVPRFLFGVVLMTIILNGSRVSSEDRVEVPSGLKGIFLGSAVDNSGTSWRVSLAIVGGSTDKAMGLMELRSSRNSCLHTIEIQPEEKGSKKKNSDDNLFLAKTQTTNSYESFRPCFIGSFTIDYTRQDRIIVDAVWSDPNAEEDDEDEDAQSTTENWNFVLIREDDGSATEDSTGGKKTGAPSPLAKLKSRLDCEKGD